MTNKEKFLKLVSEEDTKTLEKVKYRIKNRAMLRESQKIALKVLVRLDELGWKQTDLAREMGVSPQQISKIVSGKENLTIDTQVKLQQILEIPILATYYENNAFHNLIMIGSETIKFENKQPEEEQEASHFIEGSNSTMNVVYDQLNVATA